METQCEFQSSTEAAACIERVLRSALRQRPEDALRLDSRRAGHAFNPEALHVTEVTGECPRRAVLRLTYPDKTDWSPDESQHWAHTGMLYEEWVRGVLRKSYPRKFTSNLPVPFTPPVKRLGVQGYYDLYSKDLGLVLDVKSRSVALRASGGAPLAKDCRQVAAYASFLSRRDGRKVHAALVYTYREDLSLVDVFPVEYDVDQTIYEFYAKAQSMRLAVDTRTPYDIPDGFTGEHFPCQWAQRDGGMKQCEAYPLCWKAKGTIQPRLIPPPEHVVLMLQEYAHHHEEQQRLEKEASQHDAQKKAIFAHLKPVFEELGARKESAAGHSYELAAPDGLAKKVVMYYRKPQMGYDIQGFLKKNPEMIEVMAPWQVESRKGYSYMQLINGRSDVPQPPV